MLANNRGVSADEFAEWLYALITATSGTRRDPAVWRHHWPPPLKVPDWLQAAELTNQTSEPVPEEFVCPISRCVITLPALVPSSGLTYDHAYITRWLQEQVRDRTRATSYITHAVRHHAHS